MQEFNLEQMLYIGGGGGMEEWGGTNGNNDSKVN